LGKLFKKFKDTYHEYPRRFWAVVVISFIDRIGGTMLFPFFALYITQKFQVGMTQAGLVLGLFSIFGLIGNAIGGALTDKYGRRNLILFGLVFSALSTLSLGLVNDFRVLIPVAAFIGLLSDVAGPAHGAMIADILPARQRQEGFGILRVVANMSWIIGPTIGGFVAARSYFALFVMDAVISCFVALLFYRFIPETKAHKLDEKQPQGLLETFKGYRLVLRDKAFLAFIVATILMTLVYLQMYNSLSVFLRDVHGIQPQGYGFLLTTSAIVVILFQFGVTRRVRGRPPFLVMGLGALFYMVGFGMFGLVSVYWLFVAAIVVITIGEMIIMPTSQALAANFSPEEMRGRYMAVYGFTYGAPAAIAPAVAGLIMDNLNPNLVWYIGAGLCALAAFSFYLLHLRIGNREKFRQVYQASINE
jgi:MFS family permease